MKSSMEALLKSGSLFEVSVPDYKQLKACHKEICMLKELWDMIVLVSMREITAPGPEVAVGELVPLQEACFQGTLGGLCSEWGASPEAHLWWQFFRFCSSWFLALHFSH